MNEAFLTLKHFRSIIKEIHISGLNDHIHKHTYISTSAAKDYRTVANFIPEKVSVILESVIKSCDIDAEINSAIDSLNLNQLIANQW